MSLSKKFPTRFVVCERLSPPPVRSGPCCWGLRCFRNTIACESVFLQPFLSATKPLHERTREPLQYARLGASSRWPYSFPLAPQSVLKQPRTIPGPCRANTERWTFTILSASRNASWSTPRRTARGMAFPRPPHPRTRSPSRLHGTRRSSLFDWSARQSRQKKLRSSQHSWPGRGQASCCPNSCNSDE